LFHILQAKVLEVKACKWSKKVWKNAWKKDPSMTIKHHFLLVMCLTCGRHGLGDASQKASSELPCSHNISLSTWEH